VVRMSSRFNPPCTVVSYISPKGIVAEGDAKCKATDCPPQT
jgi:hypothetical protein